MISLGRLLSNTPIPISNGLNFYQPVLQEIVDMGEEVYWSLLKVWNLNREELIAAETEESKALSDYDI